MIPDTTKVPKLSDGNVINIFSTGEEFELVELFNQKELDPTIRYFLWFRVEDYFLGEPIPLREDENSLS